VFDQGVTNSLRAFQLEQGLSVTGIADKATRTLLDNFYEATPGFFADNRSFSGIGIGQCKGFAITSPFPGGEISSPLVINGTINPEHNTGVWNVSDENVAGTVTLQDVDGSSYGSVTPIELGDDFVGGKETDFSVTVTIPRKATGGYLDLYFQDEGGEYNCYLTVQA